MSKKLEEARRALIIANAQGLNEEETRLLFSQVATTAVTTKKTTKKVNTTDTEKRHHVTDVASIAQLSVESVRKAIIKGTLKLIKGSSRKEPCIRDSELQRWLKSKDYSYRIYCRDRAINENTIANMQGR